MLVALNVYVQVPAADHNLHLHFAGEVCVPQDTRYVALRRALLKALSFLDVGGLHQEDQWQLYPVQFHGSRVVARESSDPPHRLTVASFEVQAGKFVVLMVPFSAPSPTAGQGESGLAQPSPGAQQPSAVEPSPHAQGAPLGLVVRVQTDEKQPTRNYTNGSLPALQEVYGEAASKENVFAEDFTGKIVPVDVYHRTEFCVRTNFSAKFIVRLPDGRQQNLTWYEDEREFKGKADNLCPKFKLEVWDRDKNYVVMTFLVTPRDPRTRRNHRKNLEEKGLEGCEKVGSEWANWLKEALKAVLRAKGLEDRDISSRDMFVEAMRDPRTRNELVQKLKGKNKPNLDKIWHFELDRMAWERQQQPAPRQPGEANAMPQQGSLGHSALASNPSGGNIQSANPQQSGASLVEGQGEDSPTPGPVSVSPDNMQPQNGAEESHSGGFNPVCDVNLESSNQADYAEQGGEPENESDFAQSQPVQGEEPPNTDRAAGNHEPQGGESEEETDFSLSPYGPHYFQSQEEAPGGAPERARPKKRSSDTPPDDDQPPPKRSNSAKEQGGSSAQAQHGRDVWVHGLGE